jgi:hypothetical protein
MNNDYLKDDLVIRISPDGIVRVALGEEPIGLLQRIELEAKAAEVLPKIVMHGAALPGSPLPAYFERIKKLFPYAELAVERFELPVLK